MSERAGEMDKRKFMAICKVTANGNDRGMIRSAIEFSGPLTEQVFVNSEAAIRAAGTSVGISTVDTVTIINLIELEA